MPDSVTAVLRNEFAVVEVEVRKRRGGSVLVIREPSTGDTVVLDALDAEALTRADRCLLRSLLFPDEVPLRAWPRAEGKREGRVSGEPGEPEHVESRKPR